jgi:hypothetical protein
MRKRSAYRATGPVAVRAAQVAWQAPQVVALRLTRLAAAGPRPTAADWHESHRMVAEKAAAFAESWQAMAWQMLRWQQDIATSWWRPLGPMAAAAQGWHAALRVADRGLAPVQRRVGANARRLGLRRR